MDKVELEFSGINSGIAGGINMRNTPQFNFGFTAGISTRISSFKNSHNSIKFAIGKEKIYVQTVANLQTGENEYDVNVTFPTDTNSKTD